MYLSYIIKTNKTSLKDFIFIIAIFAIIIYIYNICKDKSFEEIANACYGLFMWFLIIMAIFCLAREYLR